MRLRLLVAAIGLVLVGACGGGGRTSTSTTGPPPSASTTTFGAAPSTTAPKAASTVASRPTPSEPAATALANGTYPVYLVGVDGSGRTITVDVVQVLDRASPEAASVCPEIASGGIDGYCIKNANRRLRTLPVLPTASLRVLTGAELHEVDLNGLAAARHPQRESSFYEITVAAGKVTAAKELYRP